MNQTSIKEILNKHVGDALSNEDLFQFMTMFVRVLFCMENATALPRFFTSRKCFQLARDAKELKFALLANGYTLRDCKFFVHAVALGIATKKDYSKFGVHRDDAKLLLVAAEAGGVFIFCQNMKSQFPYIDMHRFDKALAQELSRDKMIVYMNKFIHKKLKFVMNTQGVNPYDLRTEFISHSIIRVYRTYPRIENRVHLRNLLRQVIHARGISIIGETVKAKRSNLVRGKQGEFLGRLAPFHLIPKEVLEENRENLSCSITGGPADGARDWEFNQDLVASIKRESSSVKRHKFLTAVFDSKRDTDFVAYLRCNISQKLSERIPEDADISEFIMDTAPDVLVTKAIEYSGMNPEVAIDVLRTIKENCLTN